MSFRLRAPRAPKAFAVKQPCRRNVAARGKVEDEVAVPYACGILELAQERDIVDNVYNDLMTLQSMLAVPSQNGDGSKDAEKNELREFLRRPLQSEERKKLIDSLGKEEKLSQEVTDFLKLLVDTNRLDCIEEITTAFERQYNKLTDTQIVTLRSAARLEQDQEFEIAKQLQEMTQSKNIKIKPVIDESLIGGFIVEFGDNRVDLSIKGHMDRIKTDLLENAASS